MAANYGRRKLVVTGHRRFRTPASSMTNEVTLKDRGDSEAAPIVVQLPDEDVATRDRLERAVRRRAVGNADVVGVDPDAGAQADYLTRLWQSAAQLPFPLGLTMGGRSVTGGGIIRPGDLGPMYPAYPPTAFADDQPRDSAGRWVADAALADAAKAMVAAHPAPREDPRPPRFALPQQLAADPKLAAEHEAYRRHTDAVRTAALAGVVHHLLTTPPDAPTPVPSAGASQGHRVAAAKRAIEQGAAASFDAERLSPTGTHAHLHERLAASHPAGQAAIDAARAEADRRLAAASATVEAHIAALPAELQGKARKAADAAFSNDQDPATFARPLALIDDTRPRTDPSAVLPQLLAELVAGAQPVEGMMTPERRLQLLTASALGRAVLRSRR